MKATELIEKLQRMVETYGDQPVRYMDDFGHINVAVISVYDSNGNAPNGKKFEKPVEFIIR